MKHNSTFAKRRALGTLLVVSSVVFTSGCARLPRDAPPTSQTHFEVPSTNNGLRININTASAVELQKLPGIGVGIAERIVAHRLQYGLFRRTEHLMMVRGISDRKYREIRTLIVVE
ncbi:MAG: ComEA family DNA-binding protein [Pyrinomonadaceae bacterium]